MTPEELARLVRMWFQKWEEGDFRSIPVTYDFTHVSPYGTVHGKEEYLSLVEANREQFLGYHFEIHDELFGSNTASVRYTARSRDYSLEASEWFFARDDGIEQIISYYNVGSDPSYPEQAE